MHPDTQFDVYRFWGSDGESTGFFGPFGSTTRPMRMLKNDPSGIVQKLEPVLNEQRMLDLQWVNVK